jgi:hypothetical protein
VVLIRGAKKVDKAVSAKSLHSDVLLCPAGCVWATAERGSVVRGVMVPTINAVDKRDRQELKDLCKTYARKALTVE